MTNIVLKQPRKCYIITIDGSLQTNDKGQSITYSNLTKVWEYLKLYNTRKLAVVNSMTSFRDEKIKLRKEKVVTSYWQMYRLFSGRKELMIEAQRFKDTVKEVRIYQAIIL